MRVWVAAVCSDTVDDLYVAIGESDVRGVVFELPDKGALYTTGFPNVLVRRADTLTQKMCWKKGAITGAMPNSSEGCIYWIMF